jgi:hypothetical protein
MLILNGKQAEIDKTLENLRNGSKEAGSRVS